MWTDTGFLSGYQVTYNALPDVNAAYASFEQLNDAFGLVERTLHLIAQHDARDYLGVFLLHRHFSAPQGSIFVERRTSLAGKTVYVTEPEVPKKQARVSPYRFVLVRGGELQPIEFTSEPTAAALHRKLTRNAKLTAALTDHLGSAGALHVLGIATFDRKKLEKRRILLEETAPSKSIVRPLTKFPGKLSAIPTFWTHFPARPTGRAKAPALSRRAAGKSYGRQIQGLLPTPEPGSAARAASSSNGCCTTFCVGTDDNGSGQCSHGSEHIGCA